MCPLHNPLSDILLIQGLLAVWVSLPICPDKRGSLETSLHGASLDPLFE